MLARGRSADRWRRLVAGVTAPVTTLRRTARDPALTRLQLAWAAVMTASWAATVSLAVVAYDAGGSAAVAAAVVARTVPGALAGPVVGALVDRWPKQRSLAGSTVSCAVATAGAAAVGGRLVLAIALVTVVAVATMVFRTAHSAVLPELVRRPEELMAANVLSSAVESLGVFAGPALAGLLLAVQGPRLAFGVAAALFAAAAGLLLGRGPLTGATAGPGPARPASTRELLAGRTARLLLLLVLAQTVVSGGLVVLYPALAVDSLGAGPGAIGLLTSAFGFGGVVGSLGLFALAGSPRLGLYTAYALVLWSAPLLLVPVLPNLAIVLVLLTVVGMGNVLFNVTCVTLLQRGVPEHLLGRAFGAVETVVVVGLGAGAVAAPLLEGPLAASVALAVLAAPLLLVAVAGVRPLRRLDRELIAPTRQVEPLRGLAPFALLPTPELERLALRLEPEDHPAGRTVIAQGEPGRTYFVVDDGVLDVAVDGVAVAQLGPGEAFGEVALLREGRRTATVTTRTAAALWSLDGAVFLAALRADSGRALEAADEVARDRLARAAPVGYADEPDAAGPR